MKWDCPGSPKFRRLSRRLGDDRLALATLELLWHFTARHARNGNIGRWSDGDIAEVTGNDDKTHRLQ